MDQRQMRAVLRRRLQHDPFAHHGFKDGPFLEARIMVPTPLDVQIASSLETRSRPIVASVTVWLSGRSATFLSEKGVVKTVKLRPAIQRL